jgi:transcriptional regulator with XRE-family HTH domain
MGVSELADKAHISRQYLAAIEAGHKPGTEPVLKRLALALNVNPVALGGKRTIAVNLRTDVYAAVVREAQQLGQRPSTLIAEWINAIVGGIDGSA